MKTAGLQQLSPSPEPRASARADLDLACPSQRRFIVPLVSFATLLLGTEYAVACPVCFGDPESGMAQGAMWGILVLALFIGSVLMGIVGVGATWIIRSRRHGK